MCAVSGTMSPLLLGVKRLLGFSDDTDGKEGEEGRKLLGEEGRSRGVVRRKVGRDCNFRFPTVSYSIRAKMISESGHFFGVFAWRVVWRLR